MAAPWWINAHSVLRLSQRQRALALGELKDGIEQRQKLQIILLMVRRALHDAREVLCGAEQNRLFFAVLQGDSSGLQRDFELNLQGTAEHWQLQLNPRSLLLKQIFRRIDIAGGQYVERIELEESQGDSTVLRMPASSGATALSDTERSDFAD